nr:MAG TPA: hypothetical protein [Caudoviricetes sp.]
MGLYFGVFCVIICFNRVWWVFKCPALLEFK